MVVKKSKSYRQTGPFPIDHPGACQAFCTALNATMRSPYYLQLAGENPVASIEYAVSVAERIIAEIHNRMRGK